MFTKIKTGCQISRYVQTTKAIMKNEIRENWKLKNEKPAIIDKYVRVRVSVQGVKSLRGDCMFIPADSGS